MLIKASFTRILPKQTTALPLFSKRIPCYSYSQKDQRFLRFIDFDAKYLSEIPYIFKPLTPAIHFIRDSIIHFNQLVGLPWWLVIMLSSVFVRLTIFPLIFIQMKKASKIGPIWPIFAHIKETWKNSNLPTHKKISLTWKLYRKLALQQNFRMRSVFVYNLAYYPMLITMVFSLRSILSVESVGQSGFLFISSFGDIDPYFILPTLTIAAYYWNFERFITPENKHTILSKIRAGCQILLILWYPFLCCWPSGIVLYMLTNALISIIQSNIMKSLWFQSKLNPKIMHYNYMLATVEYDKGTSDSIVEAIKTGEESLKEKAILESVIVLQTEVMIKNLNKQLEYDRKNEKKEMENSENIEKVEVKVTQKQDSVERILERKHEENKSRGENRFLSKKQVKKQKVSTSPKKSDKFKK